MGRTSFKSWLMRRVWRKIGILIHNLQGEAGSYSFKVRAIEESVVRDRILELSRDQALPSTRSLDPSSG